MSHPARHAVALLLALAAAPAGWPSEPTLAFSPTAWELGTVLSDRPALTTLQVSNRSDRAVTVSVIPTCDCLAAAPVRVTLAPRASASFTLTFDPAGLRGEVRRTFLITSDAPGEEQRLFDVRAVVGGTAGSAAAIAGPESGPATAQPVAGEAVGPAGGAPITLVYYYTPGCRSCERFLSEELPRLSREIGARIEVERRDLLASGVYEELAATAREQGAEVRAMPDLLAGGVLLQGEGEIRARLAGILRDLASSSAAAPATAATAAAATVPAARLAALPVLLGGLLDGVNPCAFTTLIFLLASLALAGRGRGEVLLLGAVFTAAVFATYLAVGLGLFAALRAASGFSLVSRIIRWALVAVLVVFAGLSFHDWLLARRGRASEMLLQLPGFLKRRIHASIRTRVRGPVLAASALSLGFLVSLFEFACTGQIYLPTLAWLARLGQVRGVGLLALYNLGFIVPLLAVFAASWAGVTSQRLAHLFQRRVAAVKLALALFFLGLAALTLAT